MNVASKIPTNTKWTEASNLSLHLIECGDSRCFVQFLLKVGLENTGEAAGISTGGINETSSDLKGIVTFHNEIKERGGGHNSQT
jgi:hypothetical protein